LEDVFTPTGDVLVNIDDPNAQIKNNATNETRTGDGLIGRNNETIAVVSEIQSRLYRTEEL
jgi:hypothetical protein